MCRLHRITAPTLPHNNLGGGVTYPVVLDASSIVASQHIDEAKTLGHVFHDDTCHQVTFSDSGTVHNGDTSLKC